MDRRKVLTCISCLLATRSLVSQPVTSLDRLQGCSFAGDRLPDNVFTFSSDREAVEIINQILATIGARSNFEIFAANVPNAAATFRDGRRLILYNQMFIQDVQSVTNTRWGPISILAHEIGHHINADTFTTSGDRGESHIKELEADRFSGAVLQKMGASVQDSIAAMQRIGTSSPSLSHPAKDARVAAIVDGWRQSSAISGKADQRVPTNPSRSTQSVPSPAPGESSALCVVRVTAESRLVGGYSGECRNGLANGMGSFSFFTPRPSNAGSGQVTSYGTHFYKGNFVDGFASGSGVLRAPEVGMVLEGTFEFGLPVSGSGVIFHSGQNRRFRLSGGGVQFD
jgi:hypothetical protein